MTHSRDDGRAAPAPASAPAHLLREQGLAAKQRQLFIKHGPE